MPHARLTRRGRLWYGYVYVAGKRVQRSTRCTDRRAAEVVVVGWEREAADPARAAAHHATLSDALNLLLADRDEQAQAGQRSVHTVRFYTQKSGHLVRLFEHDAQGQPVDFRLAQLDAHTVDSYVSVRRSEGASDSTLYKELTCLRAALKLAKRRGIWFGDVDAVVPTSFSPSYKPRTRFLTRDELGKLLATLAPDRAARVAFIVATSASWSESEAYRQDVAENHSTVLLRGTKRATRYRTVPVISPEQKALLAFAMSHAQGEGGRLFTPWNNNVRRDILAACTRAGIAPCSPNDLRRTFGTWMRADGVPPHLIGAMMGHADSRMVERVYGRLPVADLGAAVAQHLGVDCIAIASTPADSAGFTGLAGQATGKEARETAGYPVLGPGIEPGTRGFSSVVSTGLSAFKVPGIHERPVPGASLLHQWSQSRPKRDIAMVHPGTSPRVRRS